MTTFDKAKEYVGNPGYKYDIIGDLQLKLLIMNGCTPASDVLEVGCGCLLAGNKIIKYLNSNKYVGIDPNNWLIDVALNEMPNLKNKNPLFLTNSVFSAIETNRMFDFIISHSVLSHAADWQLFQFLTNLRPSLKISGKIIASLRMTNEKDEPQPDTHAKKWTYPEAVYFSWEIIQKITSNCKMNVEWIPQYRKMFVNKCSCNYHDWVIFTIEQKQYG